MSLKIIKLEPKLARFFLIAAAILCVIIAWFFIKWNFANVLASRIDTRVPESKLVADWLTQVAPGDPQTHYTAAVIFEKTFDPGDLSRSLAEYETVVALSPYHYQMWLNLGKSRNLNGDVEGADAAYRRALELAPNYATIQWAYGNLLVRQGKTAEGFAFISKAAVSSPEYARAAVVTAIDIFDGDLAQVRGAMGDNETTNVALVTALAARSQFDNAINAWSKLAAVDRTDKYRKLGETLATQLASAKKFRLAARVISDLQTNDGEKPVVGQIAGGGFESGIKLRNAGLFEWRIAETGEPQIGLSDTQKRSGKFGLFMLFNTFQSADYRTISQTVAVVPGAQYEFECYYRSDLNTSAVLKWEIADAGTTITIASTPPIQAAGDWTVLKTKLAVPPETDGIILRLAREGCAGPMCRISGKLSFDDFSVKQL